ncbi:hypothetical protein BC834DRAFT_203637 [Gloeopeniophorella convolvens]|nr:hypothetical protein BC834DRAFT_203637 [Gloeopeniophorella convolvens]
MSSTPKPPLTGDALRPETDETTRVLIIGAGVAGIVAAIALKQDLRYEGFTIYEKAQDGVGGVWRENTYPGCGSDVPGHWYSFSRALNPRWASYYPQQPELRAYWDGLWTAHGLRAHTRCGTEVVRATWDARAQRYAVVLEDVASGAQRTVSAQVVISGEGGFKAPVVPPDLRGAEVFKGAAWHSAAWRHDVPLKGKRVGVIGNGCSAAQFVPKISEDPSVEVINFARTPQWYAPRWVKWVFAHVPFVMRAYRAFLMARTDMGYLLFRGTESFVQRLARKEMTKYIKMRAPEEYHDMLVPKYPPGCKRIIIDPGYLKSLRRPNVSLNYTAIERVVPEGILLKTGEIVPLDVIVFGTGFSLLPPRLEVYGVGGLRLADYYDAKGGAEAYYGLAVPNFPNYFMMLGPNSAGGHASVIFNEEVQLNHAMQLVKPILEGAVQSFAVREEASARYNAWLQNRLRTSVWNFCQSYYRRESADGKNIAAFPGPVSLFWWLARKPRYADYEVVGGERWLRARRQRSWGGAAVAVLLLSVVLAGVLHVKNVDVLRRVNVVGVSCLPVLAIVERAKAALGL